MAAKNVDSYIKQFPASSQTMMRQIRSAITSACPEAIEKISYAIPFYQYKSDGYPGRMMYFAASRAHIGVYVVPKKLPPALAKQVATYKKAKSTLQFPIGTKIPVGMIKQLVKLRMKEIDQSLAIGKEKKRR